MNNQNLEELKKRNFYKCFFCIYCISLNVYVDEDKNCINPKEVYVFFHVTSKKKENMLIHVFRIIIKMRPVGTIISKTLKIERQKKYCMRYFQTTSI